MLDPLAKRVAQRYKEAEAERLGTDFPNEKALKKYLQEHPHADKSKHRVVEHKTEEKVPEAHKEGQLFDAKEIEHLPKDTNQKNVKSADDLFKGAEEAQKQSIEWLNQGKGLDKAIGAHVIRKDKGDEIDWTHKGPIILIGGLKSRERAKEKIAPFNNDWSVLKDVVRSSVAVDTMDELKGVLKKLKATGLKLARKPKDRFAKPNDAGYRDLMMNVVYPNGHIGELQLHLKPILKVKDKAHKIYEGIRHLDEKKGDDMTPEETAMVNKANAEMRTIFDKAWEEATGSKGSKQAASGVPTTVLGFLRMGAKQYYEFEDLPAYWEHGKFPVVLTASGHTQRVEKLQAFFMLANPISQHEFEALEKSVVKKRAASMPERVVARFKKQRGK